MTYKEELEKARQHAERKKEKQNIQQVKHFYDKKKPSTSKLMAAYLFVVLNVVLVYSLIVMVAFKDLTYLGALITDIAGQVLVFFIYAQKAKAENGNVTYMVAQREQDRLDALAGIKKDEEAVG